MSSKQFDLIAQQHARQLADFVTTRPAAWQAIVADPMIPRDGLPTLAARFRAETLQQFAARLQPIAQVLADAKAAVPAAPLLRPRDAADAARVNGEMQELHDRTAEGIAARLRQAQEEGDYALLKRAVPWVSDRQQYVKPLANSGALSNALVDAEMALKTHPENVAHEEALQYVAELAEELKTFSQVLTADDPTEAFERHAMIAGNFAHLLPAPEQAR